MRAREVVIGSTRFWCPETVNDVVGVCDDLVIVTGHAHTYVWAMPGGEPLAVWDRRGLHDTLAIARAGDEVIVDSRMARRRLELATGRVVYEGPPVPCARAEIDQARKQVRFTVPGGASWRREGPWVRSATIARDGRRSAIQTEHGVEVEDVATGAIVHSTTRAGEPTLSADGRWLVISSLGPPRCWIVDLDERRALTEDDPPRVGSVVFGDGDVVLVDDALWSLDGPRRVATIDGLARPRAIRGDVLIGTGVIVRGTERHAAICRWRLTDGQRVSELELPVRSTWSMSVDGSGRWVVFNLDASRGLLLDLRDGVWLADLFSGTFTCIADAPGGAGLSFANDGEAITITHDGAVRVIDRAGVELRRVDAPAAARHTTFTPDGRGLVIDGGDQDPDGVDGDDDGGLVVVDADGARHRPGVGIWLGWDGDALVRVRDGALERCAIDGAVLARMAIDGDLRTTWLGRGKVAFARNDGRLIVRDLAWVSGEGGARG